MTIIYLATGTHPVQIAQVNGQVKFNAHQLSKRFGQWLDKMTQPFGDRRFASAKVAQSALNSSDGSFSMRQDLKPKNTKIRLIGDRDQLEIIFPKVSKFIMSNQLGFIATCLIVAVFLLSGLFFLFDIHLLILWLFIVNIVGAIFFTKVIGIKTIVIDKQKINEYYDNDPHKKKALSNDRSEISLLGYSPAYEFDKFYDDTGTQLNRGKVRTEGEFFICAGSNKYSIKGLTDA